MFFIIIIFYIETLFFLNYFSRSYICLLATITSNKSIKTISATISVIIDKKEEKRAIYYLRIVDNNKKI